MPDKKINITGKEAFKLGLIDKGFSGSVRRSSSEVSAARAKFAPEPTPPVEEVNYDPNKGQTINAKEAFKLGLVDKNFSGSVRRTRGEIDAARNNLSQPAEQPANPVQQPASKPISSSKQSTPKREKVTAVNAGIQQRGFGGKVDFKAKGAISTAAGGSTDYSLGYTPGLIKYKGSDSEFGLKADTSGLKAQKSMAAEPAQKPMAAEPTKKQMRQARRIERLEKRQEIQKQKGQQALSEGRTMDAKQKRYRYNRLQERIDRNKSKM